MPRLSFQTPADLRQFEHLSNAIWIFDVDEHRIWWGNARALRFWGAHTQAELVARDFSSDSASVRQRLLQIVSDAAGADCIEDTWTLYPNGVPTIVMASYQPVMLEGGRKGVLIDVKQEVNLQADDQAWRILEAARAAPLMITSCAMDGRVLSQNPAATECFGPLQSQNLGASFIQDRIVDPAMTAKLIGPDAPQEAKGLQVRVRCASGEDEHLISRTRARDPISGEFVIVLSEMKITFLVDLLATRELKNKHLEREVLLYMKKLERSEQRYARAVETASIWEWETSTNRLFMSPNFVNSIGYSDAELREILKEKTFLGLVDPRDHEECQRALHHHMENPDETVNQELRIITKSGEPVWYNLRGKHYVAQGDAPARSSGLLTNISERKRIEAQLMSSQRLEAVGQLTGGIAHDFNNLLTVIMGNAQLMDEVGQFEPALTREIVSAVNKGAALTRHLLAYARKQPLSPAQVDLKAMLPQMRDTLLRTLGETIQIGFDIADDLSEVVVDPVQFESAILNLAINARDAMPRGGRIDVTCENIRITSTAQAAAYDLPMGDYVRTSLRDSGTGMSEEQLARAFEPFYTTKEVGKGSGLGLSMVHGFSKQSGGKAGIASEPGAGTTVEITLPAARTRAQPSPPLRPGAPADGPAGGHTCARG